MRTDVFDQVEANQENNLLAKNGGFRQWEHCYNYFDPKNDEFDEDVACLHLTAYLACWGMYRASAFIKSVDAYFHRPIVQVIREEKYAHIRGLPVSASSKKIQLSHQLFQRVSKLYKDEMDAQKDVLGRNSQENLDTLATKVLLGTLACSPAYDRYVCAGLKKEGKRGSPKKLANFKAIFVEGSNTGVIESIESVRKNFLALEKQNQNNALHCEYPDMKIVDSYFFHIGKVAELDKEKKKVEVELSKLIKAAQNQQNKEKKEEFEKKLSNLNEKLKKLNP